LVYSHEDVAANMHAGCANGFLFAPFQNYPTVAGSHVVFS